MKKILIATLLIVFVFNGCNTGQSEEQVSTPVKEYVKETKFIRDWMELLFYHVKHEIIGPPVAARIYGYVGVSVYESLVHGMPGYISLAGQLNGLESLPQPEKGKEYDWPSVMVESMYHVSDEMLARFITGSDTTLSSLNKMQRKERMGKVDKEVFERSVKYGKELAEALIVWAETDGYDETRYLDYKNPPRTDHPEYYAATDFNQQPLEPYWDRLRPMVINGSNVCPFEFPYEYSTDTSSDFFKQVVDVYEIDKIRTEEQRQIALYWADCPGETATPPGHWAFMMNSVVRAHKYNLEKAALIYGLVSIGINDAFIQCWYTKYHENLVRPKTYIQENFAGEENWEPYVITPPFPEFASGHSVVSGCASELLSYLVGDNTPFIDSTHVRIGLAPRSFNSFKDAAREAANSRLYGGMHYPKSNDLGLEQGQCIADRILKKIKFRKEEMN
jgi:hypothetical protein